MGLKRHDTETARHWKLITGGTNGDSEETMSNARQEEIKTTPLFSSSVKVAAKKGMLGFEREGGDPIHPQYGLMGMHVETCGGDDEWDGGWSSSSSISSKDGEGFQQAATGDLIYSNINAPHSTFICGSQGVGKSHTLSCLLENSLLSPSRTGALTNPLAAIMFHYDKFTGFSSTQLCESAYLCSSGIPVRVLVSPSNLWAMRELYAKLPGLPEGSPKPKVEPLYFGEEQLNINMMKTLMAVGNSDGPTPLYLEVVSKTLRDMAEASQGKRGLNYSNFKQRLADANFMDKQNGPLKMRLDLLESFLSWKPVSALNSSRKAKKQQTDIWSFKKGTLTIIDLSCPFVDENDACALFNICMSLFLENRADGGRIVALDEAHKFLTTNSTEATGFTGAILSLIRQQRHLATRVVIATQEPTLSPSILDLCNVTIVHRFTSPAWFKTLEGHLAGAFKGMSRTIGGSGASEGLFRKIVKLRTGEAFIFCPSAILDTIESDSGNGAKSKHQGAGDWQAENGETKGHKTTNDLIGKAEVALEEENGVEPQLLRVQELGPRYIRLRIRNRVTADGGKSILAE